MAKVTKLNKQAKKKAATPAKSAKRIKAAKVVKLPVKNAKAGAGKDIDHFIKTSGLDTAREKEIGQHIGYRYDVHLGYEEGRAAIFDRNVNGWVTIPKGVKLPDNQQDRDMIARELLIKFQMSPRHPLIDLNKAYRN